MNRPLLRLLLEHLNAAGKYATPEQNLYLNLRAMCRPVATEQEWRDVVEHCLSREWVGAVADDLDETRKLFIKEAGQVALRRA